MNDYIFPSDQDRADNEALDLACAQIEALMDEREKLGDALWNVLGHVDTPIGRRKLRIEHDTEWLADAREALAPYKAEREAMDADRMAWLR